MRRYVFLLITLLSTLITPSASASIITTAAVEATVGGVSVLNAYSWPTAPVSRVATSTTVHHLTLPKFDSNLGTLLYVTLNFVASSEYNLTFTADAEEGGGSLDGILGVASIMRAPDFGDPTLTNGQITTSGAGILLVNATQGTSTGGEVNFDPGDSFTSSGNTKGTSSSLQITDVNDLTVYQALGGGNFDVLFRGRSNFTGTVNDGPFQIAGSAYTGAAVSVQYTYESSDPVPEPATVTMLGGSLLGLAVYTRRRKRA